MNFSAYVLLALLATARGQYAQASPNYQPPSQYHIASLGDNYVCSIQANYGLFGQLGKHFRQTTNFCQDAYKTGSCEKCCAMAARIQGTNIREDNIVGFNIVLKREPLCICCTPNAI